MPTSSIFSRTDGVVSWKASQQAPCDINPHTENIEVLITLCSGLVMLSRQLSRLEYETFMLQ